MERPRVLTVAELIHGSRPLTAADSLHSLNQSRSVASKSSRSDQTSKPCTSRGPNPNPSPRVLTPLDFPAIIVGTLTLPVVASEGNSVSNSTFRCPYDSCLQFSDGSASICCDILRLDLGIIGKKIHVLAWNFVPIKRGGGFLEIIRWSFSNAEIDRPRSLATESFCLASSSLRGCEANSNSKSCHRLHGILELLSPISVNPCSSGVSNSRNRDDTHSTTTASLRGFLVRLRVCKCGSEEANQEPNTHSFTRPIIVYFCGSASSWHPIITKLIGGVVSISGLKKKLVYLGHEDSHLMYVTAEKSCLRTLGLQKNFVVGSEMCVERKGEWGSYTGMVKGVYLQGMVVELDDEVWLLLTNQLLTATHSLRVGALISVRNVHFVNPKFSWTKMLILGACYKTSITVERFSPLMAGCLIFSHSRSMLGTFIESLVFSARLWVLLLVSCFRKKFHGILSEKQILGTKNMYASAQLPSCSRWSSANQHHGVFKSLFKEDSCCCEEHNGNLKLVVPILMFIHHCDANWMRTVELQDNKVLCEGKSYAQSVRRVFASEDMGIVLIGRLKISPTSGRLQLVDATGEVDVLVPDLPTCWNPNNIYEVVDYSLVIDGIPKLVDYLGLTDKSFSCRSLFNFIPGARVIKLRVCVYFHLRNATCRNISLFLHAELKENLETIRSGSYHLLQLTHKFPMLEKFQGDNATSNAPSMFAEAVIFCWNLLLSGKDGFAHETTDLEVHPKNHTDHRTVVVQQEHISKRPKTENTSRSLSGLVDVPNETGQQLKSHSILNPESAVKRISRISCSATIRAAKDHRAIRSVMLHYTGAALNSYDVDRSTAQKALLEFEHESFCVYQSLQIGCYYIIEHDRENCFCKSMNSDCINGTKVLFSSKSHLWSLSFGNDVLPVKNLSNHRPSENTCSTSYDITSKDHSEVCLPMSSGDCVETSSDVSLSLPVTSIGILNINMNELEVATHQEFSEVAPCTRSVLTAFPLLPNNIMLPKGNLMSLRGNVVAVHNVEHLKCQNLGDAHLSRWLSGASSLCLHVLVEHRTVKICDSTSYAFPPGFGPGVDVTFHRVLELEGHDRWLLTPVSFIVINSIRLVNKPSGERSSGPLSEMNGIAALETFPLGLISELVQRLDFKLMRIRCRVVAVNILVIGTGRNDHLGQKFRSRQQQVDIPMVGVVLDDGSSLCCCWANAERAATFLRLNEELPMSAFASSDRRLNRTAKMDNNTCNTIRHRLGRILQKHTRITVKNFGSLLDSSRQDLVVSVSLDKALNHSDESFLKSVVLNACVGASWTVVAVLMDSNSIGHLEKQHHLLEMNTSSMQNIWAKEVHHANPFTEAQTVIQELLHSGPVLY